jgi:hypothetical protein
MGRYATMTHAAESTHWYTREGKPAYTVKAKAGHDRPTTLADARKMGLVPSVTTIIKSAAAPALERWKLDQMLHAALTLPRLDGELEAQWIERVWTDSRETAKKAAERGTAIHAAIQGWFEDDGCPDAEMWQHVNGAIQSLKTAFEIQPWKAERSFASALGFGGKCDISCPVAVCDFKTKEFGPDDDLKTWDEHAMQLAAYRHGLGLEKARCAIVYVSVSNPGLARLIEIPEPDLKKGWTMFYSLLHYWKAKTGFESAFERLAA